MKMKLFEFCQLRQNDLVSRPAELPRQPLAKRYVNLSIHTASIRQTPQAFRFASVYTNLVLSPQDL